MDLAEATISRVHDIECSFCRSGFDDPRFLPCHDFFCLKCIKQLAEETPFRCPCCNAQVCISESEVEKLPVALAFKRIRERLSKTLENTHNALTPTPITPRSSFPNCLDHDIPLKLHCVDCDSPICPECALNSHADHRYDYIAVKADGTLWGSIAEKELDQLKDETREALGNLERVRRCYLERGVARTQRLNEAFDSMVAELERRRDEMLEELSGWMQQGLHSFGEQEEALKAVQAEIRDLVSATDQKQVNHKTHLLPRVSKARERYVRAVSIRLPEDVPVSLQVDCIQEIRDICQLRTKMAIISPVLSPAPTESEAGVVNSKEWNQSILATASAGNECKFPVPAPTSSAAGIGFESAKPSVALLGHTARAITGLQGKPHAIAISNKGQLAVSEAHPSNLAKISDREGNELIRMRGRKLSNPMGIVVDQDGCVYVSERDANCVTKFDADGKFAKTTRGSKTVKLLHPRGIELVTSDLLYVCDEGNNQIKILDRDLNFVGSFSAFVSQAPSTISALPLGLLYVTSAVTPGVQVFTSDHRFVHTIASSCRGPVCCDKYREVVYVIDVEQSSVCRLRPDGTTLAKYQMVGELDDCSGVAVDQEGRVYVCTNNQVLELRTNS